MLKRSFLTAVLALTAHFGYATDYTTYIVNGTDTTLNTHPDFASLFFDSIDYDGLYGDGPFCGATVLNSQYILTAAHCIFDGEEPNEYYMLFTVVGQVERADEFPDSVDTVRAAEFYYYSSFSGSDSDLWANDIAIIKLESALNTSGSVARATEESYRDSSNSFVTIGLGLTSSYDSGFNRTLLSTDLTYVDNETCAASLDDTYTDLLTDNQICFSGEYSNSTRLYSGVCSGDSGGPVYYYDGSDYTQVGITSFGPEPCGDISITSYYTEIADYDSWISQVLAGNIDPQFIATDAKRTAYFDTGDSTDTDDTSNGGGSTDTSNSNGDDSIAEIKSSTAGSLDWMFLLILSGIFFSRKKLIL